MLLVNVVLLSNLEVEDKGRCWYGRNYDAKSMRVIINSSRVNYKTRGLGCEFSPVENMVYSNGRLLWIIKFSNFEILGFN